MERQNSQPTPAITQNATAGIRYGSTASRRRPRATNALPTANTLSALRRSRTRGTTAAVATAPRPMPAYRMPSPPDPHPRSWLAYTGISDIRPELATPNTNERTSTP